MNQRNRPSRSRWIVPAAIALALGAAPGSALAGDWPSQRGPDHDGSSGEKGAFKGEVSLTQLWSHEIGVGYSGVSIADGKAVTVYGDGTSDFMVAWDVTTGKELWRHTIGPMFPVVGGADGGQNATPVLDDGMAYLMTADGKLLALNLANGEQAWSFDVAQEFEAPSPRFGFASNPLPLGKMLFVQTGGKNNRGLTAFAKKTGEVLWSKVDDTVGYQSPILAEIHGEEMILATTNHKIVGLTPGGGEVLFEFDYRDGDGDGSASPVMIDDNVFLMNGRNESTAYGIDKTKAGYAVAELWKTTSLKRNFAAPVLHQGNIYGFDGNFIACVDPKTGEQKWKSRGAKGKGLIVVDGHLIVFDDEGHIVVAEADPTEYKEKARLKVADEGTYSYPAFADGTIFVRNLKTIHGVKVGG